MVSQVRVDMFEPYLLLDSCTKTQHQEINGQCHNESVSAGCGEFLLSFLLVRWMTWSYEPSTPAEGTQALNSHLAFFIPFSRVRQSFIEASKQLQDVSFFANKTFSFRTGQNV